MLFSINVAINKIMNKEFITKGFGAPNSREQKVLSNEH